MAAELCWSNEVLANVFDRVCAISGGAAGGASFRRWPVAVPHGRQRAIGPAAGYVGEEYDLGSINVTIDTIEGVN